MINKIKPKEQKLLQQTQSLLSQNNATAALEILLKYSRTKKLSPQGSFLLCISYATVGKPEKAKELALRLIKLQPDNIEYLKLLGSCYHELKQYDLAIKYFTRAIAINDADFQALSNLASSLKESKQYTKAEKYFSNSLQINPNQPDALTNFGLLMHLQGDIKQAISLQEKALKLVPNHPLALYNLAYSLKEKGDSESALNFYETLLRQFPNHISALIDSAQILAKLTQTEKALKLLKYAESILPEDENILQNIGITYKNQGTDTEAEKYFLKVQKINPDNKVVQYYLAMLMGDQSFDAPPEEYVESLFDSYADSFDDHLVNKLKYRTPDLIRESLNKFIDTSKKYDVLDLGCGTGLSGEVLKDIALTMTGIDLSSKMIQKAKERGLYSRLEVIGIESFLDSIAEKESPDIIISADVFVYIGDISNIFTLVGKIIQKSGIFVFSTESTDTTDTFTLRDTGRFAHNPEYIKQLGSENMLQLQELKDCIIRYDFKKPIHGHVYVFTKGK